MSSSLLAGLALSESSERQLSDTTLPGTGDGPWGDRHGTLRLTGEHVAPDSAKATSRSAARRCRTGASENSGGNHE